MKPPTKQIVEAKLEALIAGTISRDAVSDWAWSYVCATDLDYVEPLLWKTLNYLAGCDDIDGPYSSSETNYLYSDEDFADWLATLNSLKI